MTMNAPDSTKDIIAAIDALQSGVVTAINSINTSETVTRTIYIDTAGSDTTGDGTIGLPFLTFNKAVSTVRKNINSGVVITFNFGIGTFTINNSDFAIFNNIIGAGSIIITGAALNLIDSGFTMGAALASDPFTYNVSGGNTATWTLNQWKFYFLKSGANYYPITANALTPTISIAGEFTGTEIYQAQTTLIFSDTITISNLLFTDFINITIDTGAVNDTFVTNWAGLNNRVNFTNCIFKGTGSANNWDFSPASTFRIVRCSCNGSGLLFRSAPNQLNNNYFYRNTTGYVVNLFTDLTNTYNIFSNVFENPNTGGTASAMLINNKLIFSSTVASYIKFVNCNVAIRFTATFDLNYPNTLARLILVNVNYVLRKAATTLSDFVNIRFVIIYNATYGTPAIRWFFDTMSEFVNIISGRNIQITGFLYPENEQNLTGVLTNNATTQIITGNKLQNETISIDYEVKRAGYRKGSFDIINNGAALTMSIDTFITDGTADVSGANVIFTVNYNTNEIRIAVQLSNAVAGAIKYNVRRTMITPLTI